MSRVSSVSDFKSHSEKQSDQGLDKSTQDSHVFKWTDLRTITQTMYSKASQKASNMLGAPLLGSPTVLAANGLICIGTTEGKVVVHDFKQTLICVCESQSLGGALGPVTALALSHDHTFVASGHATGHIQLYNLKQSHNPVRSILPITLAAVASGRKEGHIQGSRIISIAFMAGRHTALVSADDHGLAFFHSLGKVLFVEASDILRILGRYPDTPYASRSLKSPTTDHAPAHRRSRYTVLAMAPLPLGTIPHSTDIYNVVALLTPTKLVVVGLKPTPRTWFKCPRDLDEGGSWRSSSEWIGSLAWFPSISKPSFDTGEQMRTEAPTIPILAYSWGCSLRLITVRESRTKQLIPNSKTSKSDEIDVGTITYQQFGQWSAKQDILALQWLNHNQIVVITRNNLGVYDINTHRLVEEVSFNGLSLVSSTAWKIEEEHDEPNSLSHSLRVYKGKLFILKNDRIVVGTLLTWADRVLALVDNGDFLKAIELARLYYIEEAPGNRNNLPEDPIQRRQLIGDKLRSLMDASTQYAFSEDRMTDGTHITPDNRGVDRSDLFEGLVTVCCRAAVALGDFDYLFEDLFQRYDDSGISSIYLRQLEPFVLDGLIQYVPPRIAQRLVALHAEDGSPEYVERIIWHMDPSCLDLNQAIHLCQRYHLYDALIYIYTRAMRDYVAPIVELLGLIRTVKRFRKSRDNFLNKTGSILDVDSEMESTFINAYKIYPYLANILSGLTYPSEDALSQEDAYQAKKDVYAFLFFGRSSVWPPGEGGKLVLTSDEEGGVELTYPYVRQLLLFDSESFLHSLDIAFEDAYLNDAQIINRFMIVKIILEIISSGNLLQKDITMVNIFVARNVPKYPQYLECAPTTLHSVLISLTKDPDPKTREDRQLAAEYLLSAYNPHDSDRIIQLFEDAGFFRILRTWYYRDHYWAKLLSTYIEDPDITSLDILTKVEEVLSLSSRSNKGTIPNDLINIVSNSLPRLLRANTAGIALLLDKLVPDLHDKAIEALQDDVSRDASRYEYLRILLAPPMHDDEHIIFDNKEPSKHLTPHLRHIFLTLQCKFHPENIIQIIQYIPKEELDINDILEICEDNQIFDAVIWAMDWQGNPQGALAKADEFEKRLSRQLLDDLTHHPDSFDIRASREFEALQLIAAISREICLTRSQASSTLDIPLEDMWFRLLNSQIHTVQVIAASCSPNLENVQIAQGDSKHTPIGDVNNLLSSLRSLVQTTFGALVSITSTSVVSFPRLFKRLVASTSSSSGSHYTEFRIILTGILESYRSDEDLLIILKHLIDRDHFEIVAKIAGEQIHGWRPTRRTCQYCRKPMLISSKSAQSVSNDPIVVARTGTMFHQSCRPSNISPTSG
ncbi:lateendosome to vacuole transport-family protein [Pholiota conissans]|uniref:Lateendosome to vacuole transport-family protein n=1 Tax=Pholiota conissans TaxID=109636 RepID=A0A9P6CLQ7_9AGAR|nr:lateendosome to vacuole transport-family protein [Pholiota conissans]